MSKRERRHRARRRRTGRSSAGLPAGFLSPDGPGETTLPDEAVPPAGAAHGFGGRVVYSAAALAGLAVLLTVGVLTLAPRHASPTRHLLANDCGLVNCSAALPTASSAAASDAPKRRKKTDSPKGAHLPARTPSPSPSPTQSAPPTVTVTYKLDRRWGQRFQGHLTIVNGTTRAVAGWTVTLTFPGDTVDWAGYGGWHDAAFDTWSFSGSTLTLTARTSSETLAPGAAQHISVFARGSDTSPTGCAVNGAPC